MKFEENIIENFYNYFDDNCACFKCEERAQYSSYSKQVEVNMSTIYTQLIREAARCNRYASDLVYDIESINEMFKTSNFETRIIAFRKDGVDENNFVKSGTDGDTNNIYKMYFAIYFIKVEADKDYSEFYTVKCKGYHV